uniref:Putative mitochondrial protein n=1 Tax=Tanacetum cinerariifolium TaxID=118510 RepID=A0A6L2NHQ9_TANCI|nr:putative mitochondrial protein [Tanacetum cinerariifolium]
MDFMINGKRCVLRGTPQSTLQWMQGKHVSGSLNQMGVKISNMALCVCPATLMHMIGSSTKPNSNIQTLLQDFSTVFDTPKDLPPIRSHDHIIPLLHNTPPISVRSYKHPPNQKDAIELMVKELLEAGVIRNSQSSFSSPIVMSLMNTVFKPYLRKFVLVFFDDILVYSKTRQVEYLGHIITEEGVSTDPTKIQAMESWPIPQIVKRLRGFLGLTGYYRKFIKNYAWISKPLTNLLKKDAFVWSPEAQESFLTLKQAMIQTPVLALPDFKKTFVVETDASGIGIGTIVTTHMVGSLFYWKGLHKGVKRLVRECDVCQRSKADLAAYPGLLKPLPIPDRISSDISMDFIVGLPRSQGKSAIFVVVDRLSKYAYFIALSHPYTATTVAQAFLDSVYKLHGLPDSIVSDKDSVFLSHFWQSLFKILKVELKVSTAYHPQTDGQTEVVNKCLECYLRCMTGERPKSSCLWPNTPLHTPYVAGESTVESVDRSLQARENAIEMLKFHIKRSQDRMKNYADLKRSEREFDVGIEESFDIKKYAEKMKEDDAKRIALNKGDTLFETNNTLTGTKELMKK